VGKLTLTPRAESDLYEIWATIAVDNIDAADGGFHRIMKKARLAADNPRMGAARPEFEPNGAYPHRRALYRHLRAQTRR
jgi:plasmid stabilization system protein ParE